MGFAIGTAVLQLAIPLVLDRLLAARRSDPLHLVRSGVGRLVIAANRGGLKSRLLLESLAASLSIIALYHDRASRDRTLTRPLEFDGL